LTVCDNAKEAAQFFQGEALVIHESFQHPSAIQDADEAKLAALGMRDQRLPE